MNLPKSVSIIEVGPRDGLQNEANFITTEIKKEFIQHLVCAEIKEMEVTSFVSPKWIPQMQDAAELIQSCYSSIRSIVLVPNKKGAERLLATNCKSAAVFVGVSNRFNQKNINKSTRESIVEIRPIIADLKSKGFFVRACISTAFYCHYEGAIATADTLALCQEFADAGVDELSVADTIGMATPAESFSLFSTLKQQLPNIMIAAHFHDTRKMALANIYAALQAGIDRFDTSAGGLGGCPFVPGATGNVATEDVVYMLERMNIKTGVKLDKLVKAIDIIAPHLSRKIDSGYYQLTKKRDISV
ncbi:hydroxymethylglutaryl-CoA lyase [Lederbergia lenta]|uniref:Hydroxymethylglutaryl-CoA lyase n=1 Tax=Lederbergia lenta TaxID=1467 RepID=A0A2X4WFN2_LEDLE|nr:hydroxymethylglutaryl-CoA lyase [Lederbergia lenta]MCM3111518.1 hydroxymethylglutaryl-CoA lyase [Lederbergia lenta]MEC2325095.1 hydroxymethylglutaryl-CoA lyase [Lederbergia lenta]SQI56410.1 hydroxymethylglutaryl-CoA lyase [Lederbergia lenta]